MSLAAQKLCLSNHPPHGKATMTRSNWSLQNSTYPTATTGSLKRRATPLQVWSFSVCLVWMFCAVAAAQQAGSPSAIGLAAGLPPQAAAARMTVPDGFQVELAAGEPAVHQPIAFTIDARGRLWVAEAYTYPIRAPQDVGRDKIIILEDTDGDGTLDNRQVFAEGLNLISGLEVGFGGVWVGAAPYLLFLADRDGDDRADGEPEIVLDGFGYEDTHETLNSFIWGPDGWLYGCHGVFTHSRVGKPGTPADERVPLNAGVWRFHPQHRKFEVFAWGTSNPWGVDFDDHGQAFCTACVIPHLFHVIQGARYQRQAGRHFNPYVFEDLQTIADHAHYVGNIRDHAWWGHEPEMPASTSLAGGGHAHCGAMIYLADSWPAEFRSSILFNNIHGNRVNRDILVREGSGFVGQHGADFLLANDRWFRGINLKYGPDGGVYLIDWYDRHACHRRNPEIWDRTNGRIYKVTYPARAQAVADLDLQRLSSRELVDLQLHANDWFVRMARRLLQERGPDPTVHRQLQMLFATADAAPQRLRALWALHVTEGLTEQLVERSLRDPVDYVRGWAIQLWLERHSATPALRDTLVQLARRDPSPVVRLYLASALQRLPTDHRWELAAALAAHAEDAGDHNLPRMYWYGSEPLVAADPQRAVSLAQSVKIPLVEEFIYRRLASEPHTLQVLVKSLARAHPADGQQMLAQMLAAFEGRVSIEMPASWPEVSRPLLEHADPASRDLAERVAVALGDHSIFPQLRDTLVDREAPIARRKRALAILVRGRDRKSAGALQTVLAEPPLQAAALKALALLGDARTPQAILEHYASYPANERRDAIATLVSRPAYATRLLDALDAKQVPRTDVHAYHVRQLLRFEDAGLTARLQEVWGEIRQTPREKQLSIERYKSQLTRNAIANAHPENGRLIFQKACAACHILFGEGGRVGPDITGSNRADLDYILSNTVDPSAVVGKDYRMTVVVTQDGQVISGVVQNENEDAVTLRTINDTVVVAKAEIEERTLSTQSLMPDQLLDPLSQQEIADLIAYLRSPRQVALPATK